MNKTRIADVPTIVANKPCVRCGKPITTTRPWGISCMGVHHAICSEPTRETLSNRRGSVITVITVAEVSRILQQQPSTRQDAPVLIGGNKLAYQLCLTGKSYTDRAVLLDWEPVVEDDESGRQISKPPYSTRTLAFRLEALVRQGSGDYPLLLRDMQDTERFLGVESIGVNAAGCVNLQPSYALSFPASAFKHRLPVETFLRGVQDTSSLVPIACDKAGRADGKPDT